MTNAAGDVVCTTTSLGCEVTGLKGGGPFTFSDHRDKRVRHEREGDAHDPSHAGGLRDLGGTEVRCQDDHDRRRLLRRGPVHDWPSLSRHAGRGGAKIREDHITRVSIAATSDSVYLSSYNRLLSLHRAKATEKGLEAILRRLHYRVAKFVLSARGVSTKYRGLSANRRATITGVIA